MVKRLTGYILLAVTILIELISAWIRYRVMFSVFAFVLDDGISLLLANIVGYGPLIWSVLNAVGVPGGGFQTRRALGARELSQRERDALSQALAHLPSHTRAPRWIYALDAPFEQGFVIGSALYLTRPALQSAYLPALLAHELGHLNTSDGRLMLALNRLTLPFFQALGISLAGDVVSDDRVAARAARKEMGCIRSGLVLMLTLMGGGFGVRLLGFLWVRYWRVREYAADRYAAELGQADLLADFLEIQAQPFDMATPYRQGLTHDYTELRIDRLDQFREMQRHMPTA
jgi:Zn-dependent protease with chaperone function